MLLRKGAAGVSSCLPLEMGHRRKSTNQRSVSLLPLAKNIMARRARTHVDESSACAKGFPVLSTALTAVHGVVVGRGDGRKSVLTDYCVSGVCSSGKEAQAEPPVARHSALPAYFLP